MQCTIKPVRKHQLLHMVELDNDMSWTFTGKGTQSQFHNSHTHKTQSHTVRKVPWWWEFILTIPLLTIPPYATWHVPWWLRPSPDMFNHSSIHNAHMPLVFQPYTAILDATYFPLLLDTCDLLRERIQTSHKDGQSGHRPGTTSKEKYALHS